MTSALTKLADAVAVEKQLPLQTFKSIPVIDKLYHWQKVVGGFKIIWPGGIVHLTIGDKKWMVKAKIEDTFYTGERATLELAFKTADALMWKHAKDIWLKTNASTVLREFMGDLTTL